MAITTEEYYQAVVIGIRGKFLGSIQGREFRETIDRLKEEGRIQVVVDMGETEFMDSTGIGVLTSSLTSLRNAGGDMRLAKLKDRVHGLFMVTHLLGSAFKDYGTVEEAVKSFDGDAPEARSASDESSGEATP